MSELNLDDDPYIFWASAWVDTREAAAAPCRRCRRRRLIARTARGLMLAAAVAWNAFLLAKLGVI